MVIADGTKWGKLLLRSRGHSEMKEWGHSVPQDGDPSRSLQAGAPHHGNWPSGEEELERVKPSTAADA